MLFGKSSASSTEAEKSIDNSSSENTCKNISTTLDNIITINGNSLNAEIICCLKVVNAHWSYNSSSDIAKLYQCIFPDSEITSFILKVD